MKEASYNKKWNIQFLHVECLPIIWVGHLSHRLKCHFFITIISMIKSSKMSDRYFRTNMLYVLLFVSCL